eukprot:TRINITY_DN16575_c0_g1_i1.p1 TRINITY_DN16575_c0_g1~~TRINITY_DN16575_c0_g1_i1.p1  ORF type:complete len:327 (+),score=41.64 TRINITY_DN16575_c0_g1_i1:1-981(+)
MSLGSESDLIYQFDEDAYEDLVRTKPWAKDPNHFKNVKISPTALIKMVMHARSGGDLEVMGLLQGRFEGDTFIIMDVFALPVIGSETRVDAPAEASEYMVAYTELIRRAGRTERPIGWYHSHPGYGCWLSGIDVSTQMSYQQFQEPWLAIVVDPKRTASSGKVELGAFRTYPKDYKPPDEGPSEYQTIPLNKIEDFGIHCKQYYSLNVSYFKSSLDSNLLDLLWNKYWVNTLSSSPILSNRDFIAGQISDLAQKLEQAESQLSHSGRMGGFFLPERKKEESQLSKLTKDGAKTTIEQVHGMMSQVMKDILFNTVQIQKSTPMDIDK